MQDQWSDIPEELLEDSKYSPEEAYSNLEDAVLLMWHAADTEVRKFIERLNSLLADDPGASLEDCSIRISLEGIQLAGRPVDDWIRERTIYNYGYGLTQDFGPTDTLEWLRDLIVEHQKDVSRKIVYHAWSRLINEELCSDPMFPQTLQAGNKARLTC